MNAKTPVSAQEATVELPVLLDLKAAAPLAEQLLASRGRPLALDASKVEKIGGQCLQVLLSAAATWKTDGTVLEIVDASDGFDAGLRLLGFSSDAFMVKDLHS